MQILYVGFECIHRVKAARAGRGARTFLEGRKTSTHDVSCIIFFNYHTWFCISTPSAKSFNQTFIVAWSLVVV
jgi:hypothetical protein